MAGRYLISGAQIGVLKGLLEAHKIDDPTGLIESILEKQFVGTSDKSVEDDAIWILASGTFVDPDNYKEDFKELFT